MKNYFLVLDTETSGLPKKWDVPYDIKNNWPHVLQIAWIVYNQEGKELKRENHYLKNTGFKISKASAKIHKITPEYLLQRGKDPKKVFLKLLADVKRYDPLVIGHFVELDFHMVKVEFFRIGIENSFEDYPLFCTMKASVPYIKNPSIKYLKLNSFYKTLFNKSASDNLHNALSDAELTSQIFFHLLNIGQINDEVITKQQDILNTTNLKGKSFYRWIFLMLFTILIALIIWLCYE